MGVSYYFTCDIENALDALLDDVPSEEDTMPDIVSITCVELNKDGKAFDTLFHISDPAGFRDADLMAFASGVWYGTTSHEYPSGYSGRYGIELDVLYDDKTARILHICRGSHGGPDIIDSARKE